MTQVAQPTSAMANWQWGITLEGADGSYVTAKAQAIQAPTMTIEEEAVSGGGKATNQMVGTKFTFGDLTIQGLILDTEDEDWAFAQMRKRIDPVTNRRGSRDETLFTISLEFIGEGDGGAFRTAIYEGQIKETSLSEMDSRASGLVIETTVFSINNRLQ